MKLTARFALSKGILIVVAFCVGDLCTARAWGQAITTGVLLGTVSDITGAVVPGATVAATNQGTGLVRRIETTSNGDFRLPLLPPGSYRIRIEMSGFVSLVSSEIQVRVGEETRVDFTLRVGDVATTVEVTARAALINTTTAERGDVVEGKRITDLPLNFREFVQLALLTPGALLDTRQRIYALKTNISVNGLRAQNSNVMIDGVDTNEITWGGSSMTFYNLDSIEEFKLTTSNYSAELRGSSYNIRAVTKSGSNEVHGTVYEFLRNEKLDARNFFERNRSDAAGNEIPATARKPFRRNQFGATFGAPIVKDKLFWFSSYEGLREILTTTNFAPVPTAAERQGIVRATNPVTGLADTLFVNVSPKTAQFINEYPLPNFPGGIFGDRTYEGTIRRRTKFDQYTGKLDWQKSATSTFSAAWSYFNEVGPGENSLTQGDPFGTDWVVQNRLARVSNVHTFSPNLVNEVRLGYFLDRSNIGSRNRSLSTNSFADGALAPLNSGGIGFGTNGNNVQFLESVSYLRGRHSLKAGFEFRDMRAATTLALFYPGAYTFSRTAPIVADVSTASGVTIPAGRVVGTSLVNYLQGAPDTFFEAVITAGFPGPPGYGRNDVRAYEGYFQDDFKITPKLTLNLGLRYEYHTVVTWANRGHVKQIMAGPNVGDTYFNPSQLYKPDRNNFAPRIGFAYAPSSKTVLRSGFAIFTVAPIRQAMEGSYGYIPAQQRLVKFLPFDQRTDLYRPTQSVTIDPPKLYDINGRQIFPGGPGSEKDRLIDSLRFFRENGFLFSTDTNGGRFPDNYRDSYIINWNLTLERELGQGVALSAAYVGNSGVALHQFTLPYCGVLATHPDCAPLQKLWFDKGTNVPWIHDNAGHSTYHALQLQAKKGGFDKGYVFQVGYTFAKNLSSGMDGAVGNAIAGNSTGGGSHPLNRRLDKGPSIYDVRHAVLVNALYEPPFSRWFGGPKGLTEGWQFQTIWTLRSGMPLTLYASGLNSGYGLSRTDRVEALVPTTQFTRGKDKTEYFSNEVRADIGKPCGDPTAKFFCTPIGRIGNLGRGTFRDNPFYDIALSVFKNTKITEWATLQFRTEVFNIFNFVNLDAPENNVQSPGFGKYFSTTRVANPPVTARQIQFGLKLIF